MKNIIRYCKAQKVQGLILITLITLNFSIFTFHSTAQPPQGFSYQAIITNELDQPLTNTTVGMQVTLLEGGETGRPVYVETHTPTTDPIGHVSLVVGSGSVVSGDFASVVWGAGEYWVRVETDPEGGTNYTISGTSQLMSVPFAMVALNALSGGEPGPQGPPGEDGFLPDGSQVGAVPFWNGDEWVITDDHLYYDGLSVGIGTNQPDPSAILDLTADDKGLLIPRMSSAQRNAIVSPPIGLMIFNTSENCFNYYTGIAWVQNCGLSSNPESNVFLPQQGSGVANVQSLDIATDTEGNILVTGRYFNTATFGTQTISSPVTTAFVVKYDPNGTALWARSGQGNSGGGYGVTADAAGNVYITGAFSNTITFGSVTLTSSNSDVFIVKYGPNGNFQWARASSNSGTSMSGDAIVADAAGNVFVTGSFDQQINFGSESLTSPGGQAATDMFVVKYSTNGNVLWARGSEGSFNTYGNDIAMGASGDILLTGSFSGTINLGSIALTSLGGFDSFIANYDPDGNVQWAIRGGGTNTAWSGKIALDASGNIFIAGYFDGTASFGSETITSAGGWDGFVAKSDPDGNFIWCRRFGGDEGDNAIGISTDPSGNVFVTGQFRGTADFGGQSLTSAGQADAFLSKFDTEGNVIWVRQGSGPNIVFGSGVATTPLGDAIVTGGFQQTVLFGSTQLTAGGDFDMFLVRYSASGMGNVSSSYFGVSGMYDHDNDPTNELITGFNFSTSNNILSVIDAGGARNVDLTPIASKWDVEGDDVFRTTGNVGIGTSAPGARLHVNRANSSATPQLLIQNSSTSGFARLRFTNNAHIPYWDIAAGGNNNQLDFWQSGGAGSMLHLRGDLGNVGIRTTNPAFTLHVNGEAGKPGGGSWTATSDARLKNNVNDLQNSLEKLLNLRGVSFYYNDHAAIHELPGVRIGMIAQEVAEFFPDWVNEGSDGYLRLTFRGFEAIVVEALRELKEEKDGEVRLLHQRLDEMEAFLESLLETGNGSLQTESVSQKP